MSNVHKPRAPWASTACPCRALRGHPSVAHAARRMIILISVLFGSGMAVAPAQNTPKGSDSPAVATRPSPPVPAAIDSPTSQPTRNSGAQKTPPGAVPDPKQIGGEPDGIVQVANLVYAGTKSSRCFADHFLIRAEKESAIATSRRFHAVKLDSDELFNFPLVIMTGEGDFTLPDGEREKLRQFVERGGFLLASAGCSSQEWDRAFRREMGLVFPNNQMQTIGLEHPIFNLVYEIKELKAKHGQPRPLEGVSIGGRLGVLYSQDGLNDTAHTTGCCCGGGNELTNAEQINVNILAYSLLY